MTTYDADVAVIGAGPAGSVFGGSLAKRGHNVLILEKTTFPRFHTGESLLPMTEPHLRDFGVDLDEANYALKKDGAKIHDTRKHETESSPFRRAREGVPKHAHQVLRSAFDRDLAEQAETNGAHISFDSRVTGWNEQADGVCVQFDDRPELQCRYLVDATGQRAFMGRRNDTLHRIDDFGQVATYTHYKQVPPEAIPDSLDGGELMVGLLEEGWTWCIPLPNRTVSVGLVEQAPDPSKTAREAITSALQQVGPLSNLLERGSPVDWVNRCAGYSFINRKPYTERTVCVGDAYVFLDPIFASAIHRAVVSARQLASRMSDLLERNSRLDLENYFDWVDRGHQVFGRLISRFYNTNWIQHMFFTEDRPESMVREVTSVLAGDIWRDDNTFLNMLLRSDEDVFPPRENGPARNHNKTSEKAGT